MEELVKYVAVDNKITIEVDSLYDYVDELRKRLETTGLFSGGKLYLGNDVENIVLIGFTQTYHDSEQKWFIVFELDTYTSAKQLEVSIQAENYQLNVDNHFIEDLKLSIKDLIRPDWEQIVWLYDADAAILSEDLYSKIFLIENKLRKTINEIMLRTYGLCWWDDYVPVKIIDKYKSRMAGYKTLVDGFKNIDDHLMAIDVGDLYGIITAQELTWPDKMDDSLLEPLRRKPEGFERNFAAQIEKKLVVKNDLWDKVFVKFFPEIFKDDLHEFELNRNHIAHNKIIDRKAFSSINNNIKKMQQHLDKANENLNDKLQSNETIEEKHREHEEYVSTLREIKESEAGVTIRDAAEILEEFETHLQYSYEEITDALRFREDIEFSDNGFDVEKEDGRFFSVLNKVTDERLDFSYSATIIDEEGAESILTVTCDQEDEVDYEERVLLTLRYSNGAAIYDEEQGYYMPSTEDGINTYELDRMISEIISYIDDNMQNLKNYIESIRYSYGKDGVPLPIANGLLCYECMEEYICIDDDLAPFGTCLNCGAHNEIAQCERCGNYYEVENDDEIKLCDNCVEYYKRQ